MWYLIYVTYGLDIVKNFSVWNMYKLITQMSEWKSNSRQSDEIGQNFPRIFFLYELQST